MDEATTSLADLKNPELYVRVPDRIIFDAHTERDEDGDVVRQFKKADLERIARNNNERAGKGSFCPLTLGHTDAKEKDERKQPPIVGYALKHRVVFSKRLGRWVIAADFYIHKSKHAEARGYPRPSVELWPDDEFMDPIALLKRTPKRPLGQWCYEMPTRPKAGPKSSPVIRYSMDDKPTKGPPMEEHDDMPPAEGHEIPEDETPEELSHGEKVEQYMKHCMSHPYAKEMAAHYGMAEQPMGEENEDDLPPEEPDPTEEPDAAEPPAKYQAPALPGATNGAIPKAAKAPVAGKPDPVAEKARYRKMAARRSASERLVTLLQSEHYSLDASREVRAMLKMDKAEREAHAMYIRAHYSKAPVGGTRVAVATGAPKKKRHVSEMTPKELDRVERYMKRCTDAGKPVTFDKAARKIMGE